MNRFSTATFPARNRHRIPSGRHFPRATPRRPPRSEISHEKSVADPLRARFPARNQPPTPSGRDFPREISRRPPRGMISDKKSHERKPVGGISDEKSDKREPVGGISGKKSDEREPVGGISGEKSDEREPVGHISGAQCPADPLGARFPARNWPPPPSVGALSFGVHAAAISLSAGPSDTKAIVRATLPASFCCPEGY